MNTFTPNITSTEKTILTKAIQGTTPVPSASPSTSFRMHSGCNWQFYRKDQYLYAWKDCWAGVQVGGKAPEPLKTKCLEGMKSARGLADRIRLYETGRKLVKGRWNE